MKAEYTYTWLAPPFPAQGEGKSTKYENKVRVLSLKIFTIPLYIISKAWTDLKKKIFKV